jgi:hypothetical protein
MATSVVRWNQSTRAGARSPPGARDLPKAANGGDGHRRADEVAVPAAVDKRVSTSAGARLEEPYDACRYRYIGNSRALTLM